MEYGPKIIREILGVSRALFAKWQEHGLVIPTTKATREREANTYDKLGVARCVLFKQLIDNGFQANKASGIAFRPFLDESRKNDLIELLDLELRMDEDARTKRVPSLAGGTTYFPRDPKRIILVRSPGKDDQWWPILDGKSNLVIPWEKLGPSSIIFTIDLSKIARVVNDQLEEFET